MTRADLDSCHQAVQSAHAAVEYAVKNPQVAGCTLVMLTVPDERTLEFTASVLELYDVCVVRFREPDMGNALTAIACENIPSHPVERGLSKLPLMLRGGEDSGREHVVAANESRGAEESE